MVVLVRQANWLAKEVTKAVRKKEKHRYAELQGRLASAEREMRALKANNWKE